MIKFNEKHIIDTENKTKVRVFYDLDSISKNIVKIYERDYDRKLSKIFPELYRNKTDSQEDYFETGMIIIDHHSIFYNSALETAIKIAKKRGNVTKNALAC